jgi:hypothetical protein
MKRDRGVLKYIEKISKIRDDSPSRTPIKDIKAPSNHFGCIAHWLCCPIEIIDGVNFTENIYVIRRLDVGFSRRTKSHQATYDQRCRVVAGQFAW